VNKPAGLFTQSGPGIPSVETELRSLLSARADAPATPFIGLPHRLDRGTSGVLLVARNQRALKRFGKQFESRLVNKTYLAIVENEMKLDEGTWIDWMRKIPERSQAEILAEDHPEAKQAILHFRVLARSTSQSLVQIRLETGRMHQIRLQFSSRGFPILGDDTYGSTVPWGVADDDDKRWSPALHAWRIEFRHPLTAKVTSVSAPVPEAWNFLPSDWQSQIR
jgi:23S rRNA pseudouridine1911/1915/1917 synthase